MRSRSHPIGAMAVAPSDPKVIYVGTGESSLRSDITFGTGVYKSVDGGAHWEHRGLDDTRQIGKVLVDPRNADVVLVAAMGHAYGPNEERGVFRSTDGGRIGRRCCSRTATRARSTSRAIRGTRPSSTPRCTARGARPWSQYPPNEGAGSGIYKSVDGGATWIAVSTGRIARRPARPHRARGGAHGDRDAGLRARGRGDGLGALSVRRRRRELDARGLRSADHEPAVVLRARLRGPDRMRRSCTRRTYRCCGVDRRREDVDADQGRARRRRLPRDVDRSAAARAICSSAPTKERCSVSTTARRGAAGTTSRRRSSITWRWTTGSRTACTAASRTSARSRSRAGATRAQITSREWATGRERGERLRGARSARLERRLHRESVRGALPLRLGDGAGAGHRAGAALGVRRADAGEAAPLHLDVAAGVRSVREAPPLLRCAEAARDGGRRAALARDESRSLAGAIRRG